MANFDPHAYLRQPYTRRVTPEGDGTYTADILEFPGCIAVGDTDVEALQSLNEVAVCWLEAMHEDGKAIPEPATQPTFSGKLGLRLPRSMHRDAAFAAERDNVSLNQLIVNALATYLGKIEQTAKTEIVVAQAAHLRSNNELYVHAVRRDYYLSYRHVTAFHGGSSGDIMDINRHGGWITSAGGRANA